MLIQVIFTGLILLGIILCGVHLGIKIKDLEAQIFFWILYGVSILTFFMALFCVYIYYVFRRKVGPLGPQGFQGNPGDDGDPGHCDQNLCRGRTLAILMEKLIEKKNKTPVSMDIKKIICGYITNSEPKVSEKLKNWNMIDITTYSNIFTKELEMKSGEITKDNIIPIINESATKFDNYVNDNKKRITIQQDIIECQPT